MRPLQPGRWHTTSQPDPRGAGLWVSSAGYIDANDHAVIRRTREDWLMMYCVAGSGMYQVGEDAHPIQAGESLVAFPGLPHTYRSDVRHGWKIWFVHFHGDLAERFVTLAGFSLTHMVDRIGDQPSLVALFRQVVTLMQNKPLHHALDASAALYALLVTQRKVSQARAIEEHGVAEAMEMDAGNVDEMAAAAGMSKYHFIRTFRKVTGITPWRYILQRRINRAKDLLNNTDLAVKQVAFEVGFADPNYFSRLFRKETGVSIREFRAMQGG